MSTPKESPEQVNAGEPKTVHPTFQVGRALRNPRPDLKSNQIAFLMRVSFDLGFGLNPDVGPYEFRQAPDDIAAGLGHIGKNRADHVANIRTELKNLGVITQTDPGDQGQRVPPTFRINVAQLSNKDVPSTDSTATRSVNVDHGGQNVPSTDPTTYRLQTPRRTGGGRDDGGAVDGTLVPSGTEGTCGTYTVALPSASQTSNATGRADGALASLATLKPQSSRNVNADSVDAWDALEVDIVSKLDQLRVDKKLTQERMDMIRKGLLNQRYTIGAELLQRAHHTEAADKHQVQTINEWIRDVVLKHSNEDPKHYAKMLIKFIRGKELAVYGRNS